MSQFNRHYRLWLWDTGASTWREVDKAANFTMAYHLNTVPNFEATFVLTDENLQDLMTAGTPWRITNTDSTDGTVETGLLGETLNETGAASGSREIMVGVLHEPQAEERTSQRNSKPVVWQVRGSGYGDRLKRIVRDAETSRSGDAGTVITNYVNNDIPDSSAVALGTIDTGPSIDVKHRKDEFYPAVLDIAGVGDGTDKFFYYVHVNDDGSRTPQLNYLSPTNSLFETTDPTGGTDSNRVLTEATDTRRVQVTNEEGRIKNAVKVRWGGIGSGTSQNETGFQTDASSISEFGRREEIRYAPWIQNSATATTMRDTLEDMYDGEDFSGGTYDGIKRAKVILKTGELFQTGFDAHPGDVVAVDRGGSTVIIGRFLGFEFSQNEEVLSVEIGLPRAQFLQEVAQKQRTQRQVTNSFEVTQTSATTETTQQASSTVTSDSSRTAANDSFGGGAVKISFTLNSSIAKDKAGYNILFDVLMKNGIGVKQGPYRMFYEIGGVSGVNRFDTVGYLRGNTQHAFETSIPGIIETSGTFNTVHLYIVDFDGIDGLDAGTDIDTSGSTQCQVEVWDQYDVDLTHTHPM